MIEGTLHRMTTGRWGICRTGKNPIEIYEGAVFWLEVDGKMQKTRG